MAISLQYVLTLLARILIGALFLAGPVQKIANPDPAVTLLQGAGLSGVWIWPALAFNLMAALALFAGRFVFPVALMLAAYCAITSFFHLVPEDPWQMSIFIKNWAIAGGCLALAVVYGQFDREN